MYRRQRGVAPAVAGGGIGEVLSGQHRKSQENGGETADLEAGSVRATRAPTTAGVPTTLAIPRAEIRYADNVPGSG
jgi:hypothetical protein